MKNTIVLFILFSVMHVLTAAPKFHKKLANYVNELPKGFDKISDERKAKLNEFAEWIIEQKRADKKVLITVICTHNSRRSHMGQIWLKAAAYFYGIDKVETFSGGTEATAFNPRAVAALQRAGVKIVSIPGDQKNPRYSVSFGNNFQEMVLYSKKYDDIQNPQSDFAAVMVCSSADASCPIVPGASGRFAITYDDPKAFDNTPEEAAKYDERAKNIAEEMFYVMSVVKQALDTDAEKAKK